MNEEVDCDIDTAADGQIVFTHIDPQSGTATDWTMRLHLNEESEETEMRT